MLEKDINDLLQDYKHRKNILEEITLSDIEKWNNIDVDVSWDDILNKPTTLEGYGITDAYTKNEIKENTINSFKTNIQNYLVDDGFTFSYVWDLYDDEKRGKTYDLLKFTKTYASSGSPIYKLRLGFDDDNYLNIGEDGVGINFNKIRSNAPDCRFFASSYFAIQSRFITLSNNSAQPLLEIRDNGITAYKDIKSYNTLKLPRVNLYNDSNVYEGSLENDTYNIKGVLHDGLRLRHADGKYLMIGYTDSEKNTVYSYMICDVDGVLKNESDGDDWGPVRFEQNVFFRNGLRIGSGEDIYFYGKDFGVNSRLNSIERALANGTFTDDEGHTVTSYVDWGNVKNKPSTFTPSSHTHDYLPLSGGTMNGSLKFGEADGRGINFWNSDLYSIYMSSADNATYGGRLWETASDYNMYFKMQSGTNRGFVFKNGSTVLGGFDGSGVFRALKMISTKDIYFGSGTTTDVGYFTEGELTFSNSKGIYGKDTNGVAQRIAVIAPDNCCYLGGGYLHTYIRSSDTPQYLAPDGNKYGLFHEGSFPWKIKSRGAVAMETNNSARGRGLNMAEIYNYSNGYPVAYGNVLELGGNGANQLAFEWKDGLAGGIYHRCLRDISNSWTDWRRLAYADELNNCLPKIVQVSDMHDEDFVQNAYHEFLPTTNIINSFVNVNNHWKVTTAGTYMVNGRIGIYAQNSGFVEIMAQVRDSSDTIAKLTKVLLRVYMNADQTIVLSLGEHYFDLATNDILFFFINNNCTINGSTHNTNISVTRIK